MTATIPLVAGDDSQVGNAGLRQRVMSARRIVVKIGTNVILRADGQPAFARVHGIVESVAAMRTDGREVVLVSSGAVGLGTHRLSSDRTILKQAYAAVGQARLTALYTSAFDALGIISAQLLVTPDDLATSRRRRDFQSTLLNLLEIGVVTVINENDCASPSPTRQTRGGSRPVLPFRCNDDLAARVTAQINASLLVILTDVDGLFTANPAASPAAGLIPIVRGTANCCVADAGASRGRGGMATKLSAAYTALDTGATLVIANGHAPGVLDQIVAGDEVGTLFVSDDRPREQPWESRSPTC